MAWIRSGSRNTHIIAFHTASSRSVCWMVNDPPPQASAPYCVAVFSPLEIEDIPLAAALGRQLAPRPPLHPRAALVVASDETVAHAELCQRVIRPDADTAEQSSICAFPHSYHLLGLDNWVGISSMI